MTGPNGIIDFFLHPTFNLITSSVTNPTVIPNPLSGPSNVLVASVGLASSFGIVWAVSFAPPKAGVTLGVLPTYEDRVIDLIITHELNSGLVVVSQRFDSHESNGILFWEHLLPSAVAIDVFPNYELTVEWLIGI
jgi:hypothetical protein